MKASELAFFIKDNGLQDYDICFQKSPGELVEIDDAEARMTLLTDTKSLVLMEVEK